MGGARVAFAEKIRDGLGYRNPGPSGRRIAAHLGHDVITRQRAMLRRTGTGLAARSLRLDLLAKGLRRTGDFGLEQAHIGREQRHRTLRLQRFCLGEEYGNGHGASFGCHLLRQSQPDRECNANEPTLHGWHTFRNT